MKSLNQNLLKITELLSDGQYHDGTSIGIRLNITRAAVWKVMKRLEQYAIPLISVKGKGYKLESPIILIDSKKINTTLRHRAVQFDIFEKINSTNDYLKQFIHQNQKIRICIAECQTQGKGRLNRTWYSPFGENIYFSMLCSFEKDISELSGLSLVTALAICYALEYTLNLEKNILKVKWPNDIMIDHQKLAGTLIEIQAESNGSCQIIIGIGINVNMAKAHKKDIPQAWTSLFNLTGKYQDRNKLCAALTDFLIDYLERFSLRGLSDFIPEWKNRDCLANMAITLISGNRKQEGRYLGITTQGYLLLETDNKHTLTFSSGDATLLI